MVTGAFSGPKIWPRSPNSAPRATGVAGACNIVQGMVEGVAVGCFPDLYAALAGNPPDQVITL